MDKVEELYTRCENVLPGHGTNRMMKDVFQELADGLEGGEALDRYGTGDYLSAFEAEVAEMFGKPAGVFLPSGTMAQQIALRIWCERSNNFTVIPARYPPSSIRRAGTSWTSHANSEGFPKPGEKARSNVAGTALSSVGRSAP